MLFPHSGIRFQLTGTTKASCAIKKHDVTSFLLTASNTFQHLKCLCACRCWALALFGGNSETGFDQNTTYSIFSISITLTDEGFQNFYQVTKISHFLLISSCCYCYIIWMHRNSAAVARAKVKQHVIQLICCHIKENQCFLSCQSVCYITYLTVCSAETA